MFRDWFLESVRTATSLRDEQRAAARFAVVADLDMAGARGSALAALRAIRPERDRRSDAAGHDPGERRSRLLGQVP